MREPRTLAIMLRVALAALLALFGAAACSSTSSDSGGVDAIDAEPTADVTTADPTATTAADPAAEETAPTAAEPTVAPTAEAAESSTGNVLEIFFPKEPESLDDFSSVFPVERELIAAVFDNRERRIEAALEWWTNGPDADEQATGGFIRPLTFDADRCPSSQKARPEFVGDTVIVTLCGNRPTAGVGEDARVLASFEETLAAAGAPDAALLAEGSRRCFGNQSDEPLACLSEGVAADLGPGFPCPTTPMPQTGTIGGADEWVNVRIGPSLDAEVAGRLDVGQTVTYFVPEDVPTNDGYVWFSVLPPDSRRCLYIASQFLDEAAIRPPAGITYDLPSTGTWRLQPQDTATRTVWALEGAFYTAVSLVVEEGALIDDYIDRQEATFVEFEYDVPGEWYEEIEVDGADRAIRPITIISQSGDVGSDEVFIEVDAYTISASADVYIDDVPDAPVEEMLAFLNSITIDREAFLAGRRGA